MSEEWTDAEIKAMSDEVMPIIAKHALRKILKDSPLFGMLAKGWGPDATAHFASGGAFSGGAVKMTDASNGEFVVPTRPPTE